MSKILKAEKCRGRVKTVDLPLGLRKRMDGGKYEYTDAVWCQEEASLKCVVRSLSYYFIVRRWFATDILQSAGMKIVRKS